MPAINAQEADHSCEAGEAVRPGDEPLPVGARQTEQLTDDRQRQLARITLDQVRGTSVSEQVSRKLIGNCENSWFHVENGTATKGFVPNTPQPRMVWLVHGQHTDHERAYPPRHPPAQTGNSAVPAHRKRLAIFQNTPGQIAGCGDPGFPHNRNAHLHDGASCSQLREPRGRIAQIVLPCEIHTQLRVCFLAAQGGGDRGARPQSPGGTGESSQQDSPPPSAPAASTENVNDLAGSNPPFGHVEVLRWLRAHATEFRRPAAITRAQGARENGDDWVIR